MHYLILFLLYTQDEDDGPSSSGRPSVVDSTLVEHAGEMGHAQIVNATKGLSVKTFRNVTELLFHPANFQPVRNRGN